VYLHHRSLETYAGSYNVPHRPDAKARKAVSQTRYNPMMPFQSPLQATRFQRLPALTSSSMLHAPCWFPRGVACLWIDGSLQSPERSRFMKCMTLMMGIASIVGYRHPYAEASQTFDSIARTFSPISSFIEPELTRFCSACTISSFFWR